jgi:hypothetical protein
MRVGTVKTISSNNVVLSGALVIMSPSSLQSIIDTIYELAVISKH